MSTLTDSLKADVAVSSINTLLRKSFFDICIIDNVAKLMGVNIIGSDAYKILRTLHCVDHAAMPRNVYEAIPALIAECFDQPEVFQFPARGHQRTPLAVMNAATVATATTAPAPINRTSFLRRLFGKSN